MAGKIGPHEEKELELMLANKKIIAWFQDWVPFEDFEPYVQSGKIIMAQRQEHDWPFPYTYYALAEHPDIIDRFHATLVRARQSYGEEFVEAEREIGRLLGYSEADIEVWVKRIYERFPRSRMSARQDETS
jgi:hypothetical protein